MATVYVDNNAHQMDGGQNLLHGCLSLGMNLPYFCWHPALGSVGACRQCAVKQYKDETDTKGKIVMACMTPAAEGTRISIDDPEAATFRRAVIEGLMLNHPHDCPVCDEGGECHLQDMTVMTGHDYRRYRFEKRTWRNQNLGPLINHEMNRCIQCYRCVRYYRDYAGGRDLNSFASRDTVFFGRYEDGVLENEFSGNLVEVCPTGVFTDKTLRWHYTRKWDLQFAPSVCAHCGVGCNVSPGERYGMLRRVLNRYNHEVNGYFLCDRGRFGYEFVNSPHRIRTALARGTEVPVQAAFETFRKLLAAGGAIGIGSPRASLEANHALRRMVGPERFFTGMADVEYRLATVMLEILRGGPRTPSVREMEESDAVLVLGEDLTAAAPRVALALRQAVRQQPIREAEKLHIPLWLDAGVREATHGACGPLFIATPAATRLDDVATRTLRAAPDDIARLGFAVASALDAAAAPRVPDLDEPTAYLAGFIAEALRTARRPLVVAGPSLGTEAILHAAAAVARAANAALAFTAPEPNTFGLARMGGRPLGEALASEPGTVIVLENDLYRRAPAAAVDAFLTGARHVIALDSLANPTTAKAELVLPAATFAESDGTFVSSEGRAQRFFQVFVPQGDIQESWRWLADPAWQSLDDVACVPEAAPPATFRLAGEKIPREPHRYSGRTAMFANITVHEPKPPEDPDSPLNFSMEGYPLQPPAPLVPFFWAPGWNSMQSLNKFQEEAGGPLRGGPSGVRLIEPDGQPAIVASIPPPFQARNGEFLLVPLHHIFGSEELSAAAPAIAELAPAPYVALHPDDAARFGPEVTVEATRLPVKPTPEFPRGVAGVYLPGKIFPTWGRLA